jgi:hypothetical protein
MTAPDLPWSPRIGKTALQIVASGGDRVLCQDMTQPIRTLWTHEGRLVAIGGEALRLEGTPRAAPAAPIDAAERAALLMLDAQPGATLAEIADYAAIQPDKALVRMLALAARGLVSASGDAPRRWRLTPDGETALGASAPTPPAPIPEAIITNETTRPPAAQPQQMTLF